VPWLDCGAVAPTDDEAAGHGAGGESEALLCLGNFVGANVCRGASGFAAMAGENSKDIVAGQSLTTQPINSYPREQGSSIHKTSLNH